MLTDLHAASPFSTLLLARLICLVSRLTAIFTSTLCTSALTVFMATQPVAELLWHRLPGPWFTGRPANAEGTASPSSHCSASNLVSSRVGPNEQSPKECPNRRNRHRYYRRRCHHPFLFFQLHFSPSNLLIYAALVLLLSYVSNASPLNDTGTNSQLQTNSQATVQPLSDITNNYEAPNVSLGPTLLSSSPPTPPPLLIENETPSVIQEYVCGNIDIRNSASSFSQLRKCTVIEGYMQIVLIDNGTVQDFENLTFPKLREITDYVLLYRIRGLQSLSKLFPNLSVIRGRVLMYNYAIVIYEMLHLQDIGLPSLTKIVRGDVRIEKNPNLCFVYTIDWTNIAKNFLINANKDPSACPSCKETCPKVAGSQDDGMMIGDSTDRICWTADICQRTCECSNANLTCTETGECCPKQCMGGCKGSSKNPMEQVCFTCRHFIYQNKCYETCPPDTYEYFDRRCISKDACHKMSRPDDLIYLKALYIKNDHDGGLRARCQLSCPPGHTENAKNPHECVHCGGDCPKVCKSSIVSNIQSAQSLKGCTIINGSLEIFISSGGAQIVKELEANLKDLKEISDYLKIARSFPLITLNFLRNLKIIRGNKLERNAALLVFDNANLQDLWTFPNGTLNDEDRIQIPNGRVFFHINPKLCPEKIRNLEKYVHFGMNQSWVEPEVSVSTNGDKTACDVSTLSVFMWGIESVVVGITFENYKLKIADYRQLLGYLIYLREAEERNVSIFDGRDACSTNEWTVIEYDDMDNGDTEPNATASLTYIIPNLKPFTQYAFYMKTYMLSNAKQGAQSRILYFKTKPSTPSQPRNVFAKATKHNELKVKWAPPAEPNGNITHYIVRVTRDQYLVNHRDYCTEGYSTNKDARRMVTTTPKPIIEPIVNVWTNLNSTTNESSTTKKDGKQCCACKNEKIKPLDIEQSINFEDAVINAVFIKRSTFVSSSSTTNTTTSGNSVESNVFKVKRRRSTNETSIQLTLGPSSTSTQLSTEVILESDYLSSTSSTLLSTTVAPNVPQIVRKVEGLEITFTELEHFSEYTVEVQACQDVDPTAHERNAQPCSMTAIATVRTLSLPGADDIDQESVNVILGNITYVDNYYTRHAIISWDAPLKSNGFIMNYELNYAGLQTDGAKQTYPTHCVSISAYKFHSNGYVLSLPPGNYSIRLRARSLSDYSKWTRPVYIFIEEPANEGYKFVIAIIFVGILILIIVVGLIGYKIYITRVKMNYISVNPDYMSTGSTYQCDPKWEIAREKITLIRELGQGSFGMVYEGQIIKDKEELISCAVKTVNEGSSIRERIDFLKEADVMKSFTDCHHVVKLLGIVSKDTPVYVLMEIMPRGDLRKYLRENRPDSEENKDSKPPPLSQLLKMAIEISDGMAYLASKKFVHRDLAARNIMVAEDLTVKIGDFGMTRDIYETDYYRKGGRGLLPVRWMSPESLKDGIFTTYSDVWSYGIVIWEMATLASQPYQGLSNEEVLKFVVDGGCMDRPDNCPDILWNLMENTWQKKPKARPTFLKIVEMLLEHVDKKPFLYLSYYNQRKNDASAPADTEVAIEGDDEEKEGDSLIPLKPMVTPTGGHSDNDSSSADQLCEEDMNVQFFPLSRGAASQVQLFHDSPGQPLTQGEPNGNTAEDTTKCEEPTVRQAAVIQNDDLQDGPNGGSNLLLNNNLTASLANSESHSSSTSNANLDESQDPVIKPLFGDFDGPKHSQPKEAGIAVVGPKRSLINGHLINTSMV